MAILAEISNEVHSYNQVPSGDEHSSDESISPDENPDETLPFVEPETPELTDEEDANFGEFQAFEENANQEAASEPQEKKEECNNSAGVSKAAEEKNPESLDPEELDTNFVGDSQVTEETTNSGDPQAIEDTKPETSEPHAAENVSYPEFDYSQITITITTAQEDLNVDPQAAEDVSIPEVTSAQEDVNFGDSQAVSEKNPETEDPQAAKEVSKPEAGDFQGVNSVNPQAAEEKNLDAGERQDTEETNSQNPVGDNNSEAADSQAVEDPNSGDPEELRQRTVESGNQQEGASGLDSAKIQIEEDPEPNKNKGRGKKPTYGFINSSLAILVKLFLIAISVLAIVLNVSSPPTSFEGEEDGPDRPQRRNDKYMKWGFRNNEDEPQKE